jgi:hypothetical protein
VRGRKDGSLLVEAREQSFDGRGIRAPLKARRGLFGRPTASMTGARRRGVSAKASVLDAFAANVAKTRFAGSCLGSQLTTRRASIARGEECAAGVVSIALALGARTRLMSSDDLGRAPAYPRAGTSGPLPPGMRAPSRFHCTSSVRAKGEALLRRRTSPLPGVA